MFSGRISVSSEFFQFLVMNILGTCKGHLPSDVGWVEWDNFLPEIHQHPFYLFSAQVGTRLEAEKSQTGMSLWVQKHNACGWDEEGTPLLPTARCWNSHPPGRLNSWAVWPVYLLFWQQDLPVSTRMLSHLIQLPGWLWEQWTVRQAESCVGSHEKCQA